MAVSGEEIQSGDVEQEFPPELIEKYGVLTTPETMGQIDGIVDYILFCLELDSRLEKAGCFGSLGNWVSGRSHRTRTIASEFREQDVTQHWHPKQVEWTTGAPLSPMEDSANLYHTKVLVDRTVTFLPLPADGTNGVATLPTQVESWWDFQEKLSELDNAIATERARLIESPAKNERKLMRQLSEMRFQYSGATASNFNGGEIGVLMAKARILNHGHSEKVKELRQELFGRMFDLQQLREKAYYDLSGTIDCKLTTAVVARLLERLEFEVEVYHCPIVLSSFWGLHPRLEAQKIGGKRWEVHFEGSSEGTVTKWKQCDEDHEGVKAVMRKREDGSGINRPADWKAWREFDKKFLSYLQERGY